MRIRILFLYWLVFRFVSFLKGSITKASVSEIHVFREDCIRSQTLVPYILYNSKSLVPLTPSISRGVTETELTLHVL